MSENKIIEIEKIKKSYGRTKALDNVSFDVFDDEIFGLTGPNGAGKTTLVKCLVTLVKPDSGIVKVDGQSVYTNHKKIRNLVGYVPSKPVLYPHLSAYENLSLFCGLYKMDKDNSRIRIESLLKAFNMWGWRNEKIKNFSTGMIQKINICRGLIHDPKVLILDEPTNGLDPQSRQIVRDFILEIRDKGTTVIMTSHIMWSVEEICDRIAIINEGNLIAIDSVSKLKREFLSKKNSIGVIVRGNLNYGKMKSSPKFKSVIDFSQTDDNSYIFNISENSSAFLTSFFDGIETITYVEPTLEDIFIALTGK